MPRHFLERLFGVSMTARRPRLVTVENPLPSGNIADYGKGRTGVRPRQRRPLPGVADQSSAAGQEERSLST
ncbi:MAG: hypothetical protein OXU61_12330, partial [Gammaproteobacteria bacterium]|nr:hypothetical protein [Gammaproteobacteria bacterium]